MPVQVKVTEDPQYDLVTKVGSIDFEYGVHGRELELELRKAQGTFVRSMELQGLTLYRQAGFNNPVWLTSEDGEFAAWYALDWEGKRIKKKLLSGGMTEMTHTREGSLEDSEGMVEYRIVGVFWGPRTSIEILKDRQEILDDERAAKNPIIFRPGSTVGSKQ